MTAPSIGKMARAVLVVLMTSAGCTVDRGTMSSLSAPSPPPEAPRTMTLTVRVQARGTEQPIAGALVRHEAVAYYTDGSGESALAVAAGSETTIDVSAPGFHAMRAAGTLNSDERWIFYLQSQSY